MSWWAAAAGLAGGLSWGAGCDLVAWRRARSAKSFTRRFFDSGVLTVEEARRLEGRRPLVAEREGTEAVVPLGTNESREVLRRAAERIRSDHRQSQIVVTTPRRYGRSTLLDRLRIDGEPIVPYVEWVDEHLDVDLDPWQRRFLEGVFEVDEETGVFRRHYLDSWGRARPGDRPAGSVEHCLQQIRHEGAAQLQAGRLYVSLLADRVFKDLGLDPSMEPQFVRGEN